MSFFKKKRIGIPFRREENILDSDIFLSAEDKVKFATSRKDMVDYMRRPFAKDAKFALFMDIVAVVLLVFAVRKVIENQGAPSTQVSAFALCSFLFAAAGFYYSLKSFKQGTARKSLSVITAIIGGVLFLLWFMIFILGIAG
ncbi:hypothetical protein [Lachnoanaerobaculum sp. OBRC5-5]|uniref:hypothetical protein n=1 Tax=Lachnoanaerobaculum sp. OBRC5-5 TaxID=936595 RepID=UPI0002824E52|nr:hypothetical protein [Lachnoanaerobaculum sp. OBRC5-5]EJZ70527.1 hypothetical protein HMPREF1135_01363 [Lachnoanaerobaculum sp. OBRC5-5]